MDKYQSFLLRITSGLTFGFLYGSIFCVPFGIEGFKITFYFAFAFGFVKAPSLLSSIHDDKDHDWMNKHDPSDYKDEGDEDTTEESENEDKD